MFLLLIYLVTVAIISASIYFLWVKLFDDDDNPTHLKIFGWTVNIVISIEAALFLLMWIDEKKVGDKEVTVYAITSLKTQSEINGSFLLGTGTVGETEYYYYYYFTGNGFMRGKVPVKNTVIKEWGASNGQLVEVMSINKSRFGIFSEKFFYERPDVDDIENTFILYVPANTIIREFKIN